MKPKILALLGKRIKELRKERGLSQEQLGELAGFHFSYIGSIERAEKNISLLNLQKIADALGVTVSNLLLYEGKQIKLSTTKDKLYTELVETLTQLNAEDLRKIRLFINEFIQD